MIAEICCVLRDAQYLSSSYLVSGTDLRAISVYVRNERVHMTEYIGYNPNIAYRTALTHEPNPVKMRARLQNTVLITLRNTCFIDFV